MEKGNSEVKADNERLLKLKSTISSSLSLILGSENLNIRIEDSLSEDSIKKQIEIIVRIIKTNENEPDLLEIINTYSEIMYLGKVHGIFMNNYLNILERLISNSIEEFTNIGKGEHLENKKYLTNAIIQLGVIVFKIKYSPNLSNFHEFRQKLAILNANGINIPSFEQIMFKLKNNKKLTKAMESILEFENISEEYKNILLAFAEED